jgi:hypothetical protein
VPRASRGESNHGKGRALQPGDPMRQSESERSDEDSKKGR